VFSLIVRSEHNEIIGIRGRIFTRNQRAERSVDVFEPYHDRRNNSCKFNMFPLSVGKELAIISAV
jgi:hypothetical protein